MAPEGGRDAMFDQDKRTGKQVPHSTAEAPFYSTAKRVKPGESVTLDQFTDQPGAAVQRQVESGGQQGKLAKISGPIASASRSASPRSTTPARST